MQGLGWSLNQEKSCFASTATECNALNVHEKKPVVVACSCHPSTGEAISLAIVVNSRILSKKPRCMQLREASQGCPLPPHAHTSLSTHKWVSVHTHIHAYIHFDTPIRKCTYTHRDSPKSKEERKQEMKGQVDDNPGLQRCAFYSQKT